MSIPRWLPFFLVVSGCVASKSDRPRPETENLPASLGPFVSTPMPVVRKMLALAEVNSRDTVYDLGCGDGRILIEAAKAYGARGVGIEYDLRLCEEARRSAANEGVSALVEIRHQDIREADFSDATVVMLYLLPGSNESLRPKLEALRPGTRIVAHDYGIGDWQPARTEVISIGDAFEHKLSLWRVGEKPVTK